MVARDQVRLSLDAAARDAADVLFCLLQDRRRDDRSTGHVEAGSDTHEVPCRLYVYLGVC